MGIKKKSTKKTKRFTRKPKVSTSIKKYVNRAIHNNCENKSAYYAGDELPIYNYAAAASLYYACTQPLTPYSSFLQISQSAAANGRVGNSIKVRKATLKIFLAPKIVDVVNNITPQPQVVTCYIYGLKPGFDTLGTAQALSITSIFQNGNTTAGITSDVLDSMWDINKDVYNMHYRKQFKIGNAVYFNPVNNQSFYNNDFEMTKLIKIDVTKWYPKTIKFNDTATYSATRQLYFTIESANAIGTASPAANIPTAYWWSITLDYEDA